MPMSITGAAPFAYITNFGSNNVSVIDTATNKVKATVPVGLNPLGVTFTPDGSKVYVTNIVSNNVSVITAMVPVGSEPIAIGQFMGPLAQPILPVANFNTNVTSGYAPLTVQFTDLSINSTGCNWNFGDGTDSTLQNPIHTYSTAGSYTVNLTVSNANGTDSRLATITVLIPVQGIQQMSTFVQGLVTSGQLNIGASYALLAELNIMQNLLNAEDKVVATIELNVFISKVNAYISAGLLSPTNGQLLIDDANAIINALK
jgi:YVTN family beta-propeller protein